MNKNLLLLVAGAFLLLAACKDKPEDMPAMPKIYFTGILATDANGAYSGEYDSTDWRLNDAWGAQEEALFANTTASLCPLPDSLEVYPAQGNPVQDVTLIGLRNVADAVWHFRVVDEDFQVLWLADFTDFRPNFNAIRLETTAFPKDTLRVYYQVERAHCRWHGHGDILIKS